MANLETMVAKCDCGTKVRGEFGICVGDYGIRVDTDACDLLKQSAIDLLEEILCNPDFAKPGHRNNFAVDASIALHVLGFDPRVWFREFFNDHRCMELNGDIYHEFYDDDVRAFMDHMDRVSCYLEKWGPIGHESQAWTKLV